MFEEPTPNYTLEFGSSCRLSVSQFDSLSQRRLLHWFIWLQIYFIHSSTHPFLHISIRFLVVSWVMLAVRVLRCHLGRAGMLLSPLSVWDHVVVVSHCVALLCRRPVFHNLCKGFEHLRPFICPQKIRTLCQNVIIFL